MREFYDLTETEAAIVARAEAVANETIAKSADTTDTQARYPRANMEALGKAGLLGLTVPKELGGLGQGPRVFAAVAETVARGCASTGMVYVMHICATNVVVARKPKEGDALVREIAAGKRIETLAFSEKGSRSHFWAPVSKEKRDGAAVVLDAEKSWVTSAGEADGYVFSTLAAGGAGPTDSSLYHVSKGTKGFDVASRFEGLGMRGNASAPMSARGVRVTEGDLVSAPGGGFGTMMEVVLPWFALGTSAISIGIAEAAIASTSGHLVNAKFEHLGAALSSLPNLRVNVAIMRTECDRSRAQLAYTARAMERPGPHTMPAVLESKAQAAEMAIEVTDLAMRSCGGAAFSKHLTVERNFRDARAASVMAPTTDQLRDFLGKALLGLSLF